MKDGRGRTCGSIRIAPGPVADPKLHCRHRPDRPHRPTGPTVAAGSATIERCWDGARTILVDERRLARPVEADAVAQVELVGCRSPLFQAGIGRTSSTRPAVRSSFGGQGHGSRHGALFGSSMSFFSTHTLLLGIIKNGTCSEYR